MSEKKVLHSYLKPRIDVLHVEDDRTHALFMHSVLENIPTHDFSVATVTSLSAAARAISRKAPDLILLDLTVEDSSGIETLDRMRGIAPLIPIVITTGNDSQLVAQTAVRRGAQDYLFKNNINQDILNRTICNAIDRKIAENENHEKKQILDSVMESRFVGRWDWQIEEKRRYLSSGLKEMLGYSESELGDNAKDLQDLIHPDDEERVIGNFRLHVDSKGKRPYEHLARFLHKDGTYHWLGCRGSVITWNNKGRPSRMVGCYIDVTALEAQRDAITSAIEPEVNLKENQL